MAVGRLLYGAVHRLTRAGKRLVRGWVACYNFRTMAASDGWTTQQILLVLAAVFGGFGALFYFFYRWNQRLGEGRDEALAEWAAGRGLKLEPKPASLGVDLSPILGEAEISNLIRLDLGGEPVLLFDTARWVQTSLGTMGRAGSLGKRLDTFLCWTLPDNLPPFAVDVVASSSAGSAGAFSLQLVQQLGLAVPEPGMEPLPFAEYPGIRVQTRDPERARVLLEGPVLAALAPKIGWRLRAAGPYLLLGRVKDLRSAGDSQLEASDLPAFLSGAEELARVVTAAAEAT